MNSLFVNSLYIFEYKNKIAKKVDFKPGINIITSDKHQGNNVGKSSILKSIYHTLGADSFFSDKWKTDKKTYLLSFTIGSNEYYIYRRESLFRIFDKSFKRLFTTDNRNELAIYLSDIYNFKVMLPNRKEEKLEVATPVYSYLINFIDQDKMDGAKFTSFDNLGQYAEYKEKVIYSHFGVYDENYVNASKKAEELKYDIKSKKSEKKIIKNIMERLNLQLLGLNAPQNIEVLNIELEETKREYYEIITSLQKVKNNLIEIRNQKVDLELNIKEIEQVQKKEDKKWNKKSSEEGYVDIDLTTKILKSNELEELIIMKDELEELIISCNRKLTKKELEYKALLDKLHRYEEKLNINNSYISDILEHKGYLKAKDDLVIELGSIETKIEKFENELSYYNSIIRKYAARKSNANKEYESLMIESKKYFGLEEIADEKLKKVSNYFKADGSNLPIGTIIWHFNLLKVKDKFNKNSIKFPLLLDSPNNAELDEDKVLALFGYIFKNNVENTQLIVSTLAFNKDYYSDIKFDNIIKLDNDKYKLLNRTDYDKYKHILELILAN